MQSEEMEMSSLDRGAESTRVRVRSYGEIFRNLLALGQIFYFCEDFLWSLWETFFPRTEKFFISSADSAARSLELDIVRILETKLFSIRSSTQGDLYEQCGRDVLLKQIRGFIEEHQPIQLLLPAFPCKSPNLEKVCGKLPDAGEVYALEYLNDICREISLLYENGCQLTIWSDGRVFGDLICVPPEDIAQYEQLLKYYSSTMTHLQWDSMNNYIDSSQNGDTLIEKYGTKSFSFDQWLSISKDHQEQYSHLRRFMGKDLENISENKQLSRRQRANKVKLVAEQMLRRNEALTNLLKQNYPNHIRLSIHQHINDGNKFTIRFFSDIDNSSKNNSCNLRTPWHNVLVINNNGKSTLMPYRQLHLQTEHVPIIFNDQIWCFVQLPQHSLPSLPSILKLSILSKSPRFCLSIDLNKELDVFQLNSDWMKMLLQKFGAVVLRQSQSSLEKDTYLQFCEQFGPPVVWKFGPLLKIKPTHEPESGHESREKLPLHFDLSYPPEYLRKTGLYEDYVPQHFMLYCVQAPSESSGGKTQLINGRLLLESIGEKDFFKWKAMSISSVTPKSFFGGRPFAYPMIMSHPKTNENILRFNERSNTVSQPINSQCSIDGNPMDSTIFDQFNHDMEKMMRDPNWYIEHTWNNDDLVIIENHLLLHGRTPMIDEADRELWRVQVY